MWCCSDIAVVLQALLIIVGNPAVLRCDPNWLQLLRLAQDNGCTKGSPMPDMSESATAAAATALQTGLGSRSSSRAAGAGFSNGDAAHTQEQGVTAGISELIQQINALVMAGPGGGMPVVQQQEQQQQLLLPGDDLGFASALVQEAGGGMVRHH